MVDGLPVRPEVASGCAVEFDGELRIAAGVDVAVDYDDGARGVSDRREEVTA